MVASTVIKRLSIGVWWLALGFAAFGLTFRSLVWSSWLPAPNEPYGAADILELLVWYLLLVLCAFCILLGGAMAFPTTLHHPKLSRRLLLTGLLIPVGYYFLQPLMPVFRLW